jgi:hypothetical protein
VIFATAYHKKSKINESRFSHEIWLCCWLNFILNLQTLYLGGKFLVKKELSWAGTYDEGKLYYQIDRPYLKGPLRLNENIERSPDIYALYFASLFKYELILKGINEPENDKEEEKKENNVNHGTKGHEEGQVELLNDLSEKDPNVVINSN